MTAVLGSDTLERGRPGMGKCETFGKCKGKQEIAGIV